MVEGIGAAILGFLAQYAAGGVLDRTVAEKIDAFQANRGSLREVDRAMVRALDGIEAEHAQSARALREPRFVIDQAPVELHKLFTSRDGPNPRALAELCRDYHGHLPGDIETAAAKLIENLRRELFNEPAFRPLIMASDVAFTRERIPAIEDSLAGLHAKLDRLAPATGESGREPIVPMQIPDPVADFQGREDALARVVDGLCRAGGAAVSAIHGMGGIGKTELARRVAKEVHHLTPGGQIAVDLLGTGAAPLGDLQAMAEVVRAFDPRADEPTSESAAIDAYNRVLHDRRTLLLLDNARDGAQVKRLVEHRPEICLVLVTARQTIGLPGLVRVPLEELQPDEARALLRSEMGEERASNDQLDVIAERCGWLPLALRAAGRFLAEYERWSIEDYLADLADEKKGLQRLRPEDDPGQDVAAVLSFSARQLHRDEPELALRWQQLAVFPAAFDVAAAAAVWDLAPGETQAALARLHRRSMVLPERGQEDRWRLHDLMRDVVQVPLKDQDGTKLGKQLEAARTHHARHYCGVLGVANDLYLEGGAGELAGLALYDLEQSNFLTGQAWSAARIGQDHTAARLAAGYADAGYMILGLRLTPSVWMEWLEAQRKACHRLG